MAILHIHIQRFYGRKTHPFLFLFCCSLKTTFPSLVNCNHNKRNTARIITLPKSSCYFKTFGHEKNTPSFMFGIWIFAPKRPYSLRSMIFELKDFEFWRQKLFFSIAHKNQTSNAKTIFFGSFWYFDYDNNPTDENDN